MKFWGIIVAALYVLVLFALLISLAVLTVPDAQSEPTLWQSALQLVKNIFAPGQEDWTIGIYFIILLVAQAGLLSVPVDIADKRPVTKRTIVPLVIVSALMMGLLAAGAIFAIDETVRKDFPDKISLFIIFGIFLLVWGFWARMFFSWSKKMEPKDLISKQCQYLFKGSILELLIVVPAHIVARQRDYCCAGFQTFIGIAFGLSVMLFTFGPGVFFLFAERLKHLRKKQA